MILCRIFLCCLCFGMVACSSPALRCSDPLLFQSQSLVVPLELTQQENKLKAQTLKPFSSDGCSVFPDGSLEQKTLWQQCCITHDFAYWQGGTYQARRDADLALKDCVMALGKPWTARAMRLGVRFGGTALFPTPFRWGYGWSYPRWYGALSEKEQWLVKQGLESYRKHTVNCVEP